MGNIELSLAINSNPRSNPILSGRVSPQGIDLACSRLHASELFWRQLGFQEFQVSEMSMSSLLISRSHGIDTWVGIPIFTTRHFFHTGVLVREDSGVTEPAQLAGKRVGVPEYQQTAALWTRGILQHEFDLDPKSMHWWMERPPEKSHGGATGFTPPPGIDLQYIPATTDMGEMLKTGELDAALHYLAGTNNLVDRSSTPLGDEGSGVRHLFNKREESARYFQKTGLFPINHCVVVRKDVAEKYPWVMLNLYSAFLEAKQIADTESLAGSTNSSSVSATGLDPFLDTGLIDTKTRDALKTDLYPYGVTANRKILETITEYSFEQGLSSRKLDLAEIFYPPTLEL
jgi:4,5-dihydroxyphthalate decarboxylase